MVKYNLSLSEIQFIIRCLPICYENCTAQHRHLSNSCANAANASKRDPFSLHAYPLESTFKMTINSNKTVKMSNRCH